MQTQEEKDEIYEHMKHFAHFSADMLDEYNAARDMGEVMPDNVVNFGKTIDIKDLSETAIRQFVVELTRVTNNLPYNKLPYCGNMDVSYITNKAKLMVTVDPEFIPLARESLPHFDIH